MNNSFDTFACIRCGATVPVAAVACPACGLEIYPESSGSRPSCPTCGSEMEADETICHQCGAEVVAVVETPPEPGEDNEYICSECGGDVAAGDTVCPHCGANVEEIEETPPEAEPARVATEPELEAEDGEDEYVCSECGGDVAADDKVCPHCGANVEEIEETSAEAEPVRNFTAQEVVFLADMDRVLGDHAGHFVPASDGKLILPAREPKVGDLAVQFGYREVIVTVGRHTEVRFGLADDAAAFIHDVVTGRLAFHFDGGEVEMDQVDKLGEADKNDWSYYVWSGPLRNQLTGVDWYRPPEG